MTAGRRGLLDTSVLIAQESGRRIEITRLPDDSFVSVITIAELEAGVLAAPSTEERGRRLLTLTRISHLRPLGVESSAAHHWAQLRVALADAGRRLNVNDLWIASIALANGLPVVTQDDDFDVIADLGGPELIKV